MPWILDLNVVGKIREGRQEGERRKGEEKGERLRNGDTGKERVCCSSAQELSKKAKFLDHMGSFLDHLLQVKP